MTGINVSLMIDLDRLLELTGYRVRFRTNEWVECLLLGPHESFVGRGEDQNEALLNALYSALPTRLAQKLLERALADERPRVTEAATDETTKSTAPDAAPGGEPEPAASGDCVADTPAADSAAERRSLSQDEVRAYLEEWQPPAHPSTPRPVDPIELLQSFVDRARAPSALATDVDIIDELELLDEITRAEEADRWLHLPAEMQRVWLGYLVARMRAVKERAGESLPDLRSRVGAVIKRFPEFSARTRPGHVNGLKVSHTPETGTWSGDAHHILAELRAFLSPTPDPDTPAPHREPKAPRPKRDQRDDARDDQAVEWEHREAVASMRVVMYGGSPREDARVKLERTLGIGSLEWPDSDRPRRVDALAQRIASGSVDLLLIVRSYVQHKDASKLIDAARASGTRWALVDAGYGIAAVKTAMRGALCTTAPEA